MSFLISHWRVIALIGLCLAGIGLYLVGKHDGRLQTVSEQLRNAVKAEKERGRDDEKLRGLSDYDFCVLALRRRGVSVGQCDELRGVEAE
ncbi:hypothetical protein [Brucella anthropi]|uniref:hypothetical protein n=1 Tax=Brucella anthropi TaxID=529 RepID=UPI00124D3A30|nr:hypothetical protein [Brucella anthropi]KAB2744588.1 hypothetical protein F9L05_22800 [Brucella anthropi]